MAFYSPGCGRCRRLLPSWSQAAQLIEDEDLPIRLARIDLSSRGGMLAWKAFGLSRVPTVKASHTAVQRTTWKRTGDDAVGRDLEPSLLEP